MQISFPFRRRSHQPPQVERVTTQYGDLFVPLEDDYVGPYLLRRGIWEPGETAVMEERVREGMIFVDVGAHLGYFTLLAARMVGRRGHVFAFEAHPRNVELLRANVSANGLRNVTVVHAAVTERSGHVELFAAPTNTGDHRIYAADDERDTIRVRAVALDDFRALRTPVDVVKIDIQGAEEVAVRGMERVLARSPSAVASVEFWPHGILSRGHDPLGVLAYYRSLGFDWMVIDPEDPAVAPASWDDADLIARCLGEKDGWGFRTLVMTRSGCYVPWARDVAR